MKNAKAAVEAKICRSHAGCIRRRINAGVMSLREQLSWLGVAERYDRLADALELPALSVAS
jgi:hypothetical protein